MKESIGGTWLFGIVITFIVFFTTFISISTNHSKTFRVKDEILNIIEFYKGVNDSSLAKINDQLAIMRYFTFGECMDNSGEKSSPSKNMSAWYGFVSSDPNKRGVKNSTRANYCIRKYVVSEDGKGPIGHPSSAYYQVVVFFKLDWPIIRSVFNIRIEGETSLVYRHKDKFDFAK